MIKLKHILIILALLAVVPLSAQRVFMAGDSHIALKTYPQTLGAILEDEVPGLTFDSFGIGGAGFYTYVDKPKNMQRLYDSDADIMIIALGTNDCNNWYYSPEKLRQRALKLYNGVKEHNPDCTIVFVTPFYFKTKEVRGTQLEINPNVAATAQVLNELAQELPDVWTIDLVARHGMDFLDRDLMKKDFIHLTNEGYEYLAELVAEGLFAIPGLLNHTPLPLYP